MEHQGIKELHELFGMPETTISEFLSLLKAKSVNGSS